MPSGRVRTAELATSMLVAAPLVALLSVPAGGVLGIKMSTEPQQLAYLAILTLLGSWGTLVPAKLLEGRNVEPAIKRLLFLGTGVLLGIGGLFLGQWIHLGPGPAWVNQDWGPDFRPISRFLSREHEPLRYMSYFGLLYLANGWWKLTARDRKARFRFWPTLLVTGIAGLLFPLWPQGQPVGVAVAALVAIVTQVVSPWSEQAATYARYKKKYKTA
jgi:hypothetical protein